jgi:XTP/dITP diphosphohydrolase
MDRLRVACPWDARQTPESLAPCLLEECYEALAALESKDPAALADELGDVLLQVVFQARIAAESGTFTIDDVAERTVAKLIRRHPHVFGDVTVSGPEEVKRNWDTIKAEERGGASVLDSVPFAQPALSLAAQLQRRAERAGGPAGLPDGQPGVSGLGLELFALVTRARRAGLDPELELRAAARCYAELVREWEQAASQAREEPASPAREGASSQAREGGSGPRLPPLTAWLAPQRRPGG